MPRKAAITVLHHTLTNITEEMKEKRRDEGLKTGIIKPFGQVVSPEVINELHGKIAKAIGKLADAKKINNKGRDIDIIPEVTAHEVLRLMQREAKQIAIGTFRDNAKAANDMDYLQKNTKYL